MKDSWCAYHKKTSCSTLGKGLYAVHFDDELSNESTKANAFLLRAHSFKVTLYHPNDAWCLVKQWLHIGLGPYLITMDLNHSRGREYPPDPSYDTPTDGWGLGSYLQTHLPDVNIVAVSNLVDKDVAQTCEHIGFMGLFNKGAIRQGLDDPYFKLFDSLRSPKPSFVVTEDIILDKSAEGIRNDATPHKTITDPVLAGSVELVPQTPY